MGGGDELKLAALKAVLPVVTYPELVGFETADFNNKHISAKFNEKNVPEMWYVDGDVKWTPSTDTTYLGDTTEDKYVYSGDNTAAGDNNISSVQYHMYDGKNPFYTADGSYNTATFGGEETRLERFMFYRFTGDTAGPSLDNMLVAVDTYTRLIFGFGKPTAFVTILGNDNPTRWEAVEVATTAPDGTQYKFYEYDPAGYVDKDGKFVMYDWYKKNLEEANKNNTGKFDPQFTGTSPYLIELGAVASDGGYAVSGNLTAKAKSIKNISIPTDTAFTYSVRSLSYNGRKPTEPEPVWSDITGATASLAMGATEQLVGEATVHTFTNVEDGLTLELDSKIEAIGRSLLTDHEKPIILLGYDRYTQTWLPKADNAAYVGAPIKYNEDFQVRFGETKDFVVTIPAGFDQEIELCYEISWTTDGTIDDKAGQIFSAKTTSTDPEYVFSGSNGAYALEYTDLTEASSYEAKLATIELSFANLHIDAPIKLDYTVGNTTSGFLGYPKFDGNNTNFAMITAAKPTVTITVPLTYDPTKDQVGTLILKLSDESGLNLYDTGNSPKIIEISIKRNKFIPINAGIFDISNIKLKNIDVLDENSRSLSVSELNKRFESEFSWDIKTRRNEGEWEVLSASNETPIRTENTHTLTETKSYAIESLGLREEVPTIDFSAEIMEIDGSGSDVILKHDKPLVQFKYNPLSDSWNIKGKKNFYFTDENDNKWQIKGITMEDALRDGDIQTVTVSISSYIQDTYYFPLIGGEGIAVPTSDIAGWCNMELSFDVAWRNK